MGIPSYDHPIIGECIVEISPNKFFNKSEYPDTVYCKFLFLVLYNISYEGSLKF